MIEVIGTFTGKKIGPTFFRGSKPIDGIWATPDIIDLELGITGYL
jgi:hypothetical protein